MKKLKKMKHGEGMEEGYTDEEIQRCVTQKTMIVQQS